MIFTISQKAFSAVINRVKDIAVPRSSMPILENVRITASELRPVLHISATDLEVGYTTAIDCHNIEVPGSITIPARKLNEVVKAAPTEEITLTLNPENDRVTVTAGTFVTTLAGLSAEEFPEVKPLLVGEAFQLDAAALLQLLGHVDYCQSNDNTKYNLNGVFLQIADAEDCTRLYAAATDGHRLAFDSVPLPGEPRAIPVDLARGIIIPRKGIAEIRKIGNEGVLCLQIAGNNLSISTENETITLRLIDGEFPKYQNIIPKKYLANIEANRQPLIDALGRVSLLAEGKMHGVSLEFTAGHIRLNATNPQLGIASDRVIAGLLGETCTRRVNAAFLVQTLGAFDCGMVQISPSDETGPLRVTPLGEEEPCAIIMPLRG
jgi:DNA polymerase-3 subunit beta